MSTHKYGEEGTLDTMSQIWWSEARDLEYYEYIHGDEGGSQKREHMMERIEENLGDYVDMLDHAIQFLWHRPHELDRDVLSLMSVDGKIALLRQLILERSNEMPAEGRLRYLARFEDSLDTYTWVEQLRNKILRRYLLEPSRTWLRELVDADDWIVSARSELEESMFCEHQGFVQLRDSRRG